MRIGYMRPDQDDPDCEVQVKKLTEQNCAQIISEAHASAKKRIQLENMMKHLQQGDEIVVHKLYTLADSTRHLMELLDIMEVKEVYFQSLKEGIDTSNKNGYSFRYVVTCLAGFQSDVISEKTKKGLNKAKQKGISTGRPRKPDENVQRAIVMYESKKYSLADIKNKTGISKSTLYRYLEN
ncbi:recombinase family protein [Virgibacillus alimentarius]|uniref:DNA invertase Pin-like site-specific DNA recombinase n=1 Tax=Virgibacillus alimentarius TaxID=698769 RepID=A0ABS4S668_9BACI|nr:MULTISPECIES: recombinase family protein [Virgibacillus]MBP2256976.1 DNA invertase Pin-like site-specific DNA recombinase [Virgibacillus alimentarius]HLR68035.1 recombinase family protein [Virgibacillus sp.]